MNADQLKAYKRDKSKKFNAHLRDLRLKEKKRIADNQPEPTTRPTRQYNWQTRRRPTRQPNSTRLNGYILDIRYKAGLNPDQIGNQVGKQDRRIVQ